MEYSRKCIAKNRMTAVFLFLFFTGLSLLFAGKVRADEFPEASYTGKDVYIIGNVEHVFFMHQGLEGASDAAYISADPSIVQIISTSVWNTDGVPLAIIIGKKAGTTQITVNVSGGSGNRTIVVPIHVVRYENPLITFKIGLKDLARRFDGNTTAYYAGPRGKQLLSYSLKSGWTAKVTYGYWNKESGKWVSFTLGNGKTIDVSEIYNKTTNAYSKIGRIDIVLTHQATRMTIEDKILISDTERSIPALPSLPGAPSVSPSPVKVTVTMNGNGSGASVKKNKLTVTVGKTYGDLPSASRTGYKFMGWYTKKSGGSKVTKDTKVTNNKNHTLYAHWKAITYKVSFQKNNKNASGSMSTITMTYGQEKNLPKSGFTMKGWYVKGWSTSTNGGVKYRDQQSVKNLTAKENATVKLYAVWEKNITLGAIQNVKVSLAGGVNNLKVTWNTADWAVGYEVYLRESSSGTIVQTVSANSPLIKEIKIDGTNLKSNKKYYISVKGVSWDNRRGKESSQAAITTLPETKITEVSKKTMTSVFVKWEKKTGITGYQLMVTQTKGKADRTNKSTKNTEYVAEQIQPGIKLYYYVRTYKKSNDITTYGKWSPVKEFTINDKITPATPKIDEKEYTITAKFKALDEHAATYKGKYTDKYFTTDATVEQKGLELLSCLGAATTYGKHEQSFINDCGFVYYGKFEKNSTLTDNDHGRVNIGYKILGDGKTAVIAALISGYNDKGFEWISNFNVGLSQNHEGFHKAAFEVKSEIDQCISAVKGKYPGVTIKYWLMGHSRGGALTSIIAQEYSDTYGQGNVYAFGFATPKSTTRNVGSYRNIRNFLVEEDFVPTVAPEKWGYRRYGTDIILKKNNKQKECFASLTGTAYTGFSPDETKQLYTAFCNLGGKDAYSYKNSMVPTLTIDKIKINGVNATNSAECYAKYGLAAFLTKDNATKAIGLSILTSSSLSNPDAAVVSVKMVSDQTKFKHSHCIGNYVAALSAY